MMKMQIIWHSWKKCAQTVTKGWPSVRAFEKINDKTHLIAINSLLNVHVRTVECADEWTSDKPRWDSGDFIPAETFTPPENRYVHSIALCYPYVSAGMC